jgi:hypothetical protein
MPATPDPREHGTTYPLLGSLVVLLLLAPLVPDVASRGFVMDVFLTGVVFGAFWLVHRDRRRLWTVGIAGTVAVALVWTARATGSVPLLVAAFAGFGAILVHIMLTLLRLVLRARRVSFDSVSGAIAAYLILAWAWACAFAVVELVAPGSLEIGGEPLALDAHPLETTIYFALTTQTTVGYGDVVPIHPLARNLAVLCAVSGQMYVAVLVAALVARFVADDVREG